ncbi:MAG: hypothetical protein NTX38_02310 [Methylobacter sp.]|nr:hypothetical protein [Methylobacter sp.]
MTEEKDLSTEAYVLYRRIEHFARVTAVSKEMELRLQLMVKRAFSRYVRRKNASEHFFDY